jgi:biotin/methionine sulfoxide reductase
MTQRPAPVQTASHWGVAELTFDAAGGIDAVLPSPLDPNPSPLIAGLPEVVRGALRIDCPYVRESYLRHGPRRASPRGSDGYVAVSWGTALDLVERAMRDTKERFGNEAIYGGSYGWASAGRLHHAPSLLKRFLGLYGGFVDKSGNHSFGAALGIMPYILGRSDITSLVTCWDTLIGHCDLIVLFGGAHLKNSQIEAGGAVAHEAEAWFRKADARGTRFINISPSRQDLPAAVEGDWIAIRPNTDVALMLGLAHELLVRDLLDRAFLDRYCVGFDIFARYLTGDPDGTRKDANWASKITGVPRDTIEQLAGRMARGRTMIATAWSVQRAHHGEQPVWMTVALAAMLGQIGLPGGGFSIGFGATSGIAIDRPAGIPRPTLPLGPNAVKTSIPVACVSDMLLHPGKEICSNGRTVRYPDIKLIYSAGGNPFHHNTDTNTFLQAWQKPDTVIVHEPFWCPVAKHADIVLPATTTLERNDILAAERGRHWVAMYQVIDAVGQSRNDFDIFAELADQLGFGDAFTASRDEMGWLRAMYGEAQQRALGQGFDPPDFDTFWDAGSYEFKTSEAASVLLGRFREDPDAHPLKTPSGRIEIFSETIARFGYDDCPPHPSWLEPAEWLGSTVARRYPIHLLSNQPCVRLHSQLDMAALSRNAKIADREPIIINAADARERGISFGDVVRVYNDRGAFLAAAVPSEDLIPGVAQIATGAWYDPDKRGSPGSLDKHGSPNVVTMGGTTSKLAHAPTAQTVLVEIVRMDDAPLVTAFERPAIIPQDHNS